MEHETFWTLLQSAAHWQFELFLMFLFDVVIGLVLYPFFKRAVLHHKTDDVKIDELEEKVDELQAKYDKLLSCLLNGTLSIPPPEYVGTHRDNGVGRTMLDPDPIVDAFEHDLIEKNPR